MITELINYKNVTHIEYHDSVPEVISISGEYLWLDNVEFRKASNFKIFGINTNITEYKDGFYVGDVHYTEQQIIDKYDGVVVDGESVYTKMRCELFVGKHRIKT